VHCVLAVHTPIPDAHGQSTVHARSTAVLQIGLSVHTASLVAVPALVRFWLLVQVFHAVHEPALAVVEKKPDAHALQVRSFVSLPATAE